MRCSWANWGGQARRSNASLRRSARCPSPRPSCSRRLPALAAARRRTSACASGPAVLNKGATSGHPARRARGGGTLDVLSYGRSSSVSRRAHAIPIRARELAFDPAPRVSSCWARRSSSSRALSRGESSVRGTDTSRDGSLDHPPPAPSAAAPFFIGGMPRASHLAAREADIVGLTGIAFRHLRQEPSSRISGAPSWTTRAPRARDAA